MPRIAARARFHKFRIEAEARHAGKGILVYMYEYMYEAGDVLLLIVMFFVSQG